ncbi:major facilitator superfamily domain-containing protein [Mycena rebaudengoi]|nr:major facilitator superfamily domain-containing protein [Mycena rebaudengoi]
MSEKRSNSDHSTDQMPSTPKAELDVETLEREVPDEGLEAWATVAGGFIIYFTGLGYFNAYGVYQDFYVREYMANKTPSEIAWIGSCQIALQFILGLPVGKAFDAGYFHHLMIAGSIIYCFSLWMLSFAQPNQFYQVFLAQGVGLGIGLGLTFLPALSVAAHHFSRRRGLAMGIMTCGASIGGIIFPIMLNNLMVNRGFAAGVRASAGLITALMLLANVLMRPRYPKNRPETSAPFKTLLRDPPYMAFVISGIFIMLGLFYPIFYLQIFSIEHGINEKVSFYTISFINAGGVLGRLIPNFLADRVGSFNILIPVTFLTACSILALIGSIDVGGIIFISLLYGAMNAGYVSITPAVLADLSKSRSEVGLRMGVWFSFAAAAALAGQPISGALIRGNFIWSTVFAGLCVAIGGFILIVSRFLFVRRQVSGGGHVRRA